MEFINFNSIPYSERPATYVKLSYSMGYDQDGNYGKNKVAHAYIMQNGECLESKFNYADESKETAIKQAEGLGLNFILVSHE
jgi:hypothetical protein